VHIFNSTTKYHCCHTARNPNSIKCMQWQSPTIELLTDLACLKITVLSFSPVVPAFWIAAFEENSHRFVGRTDLMLPEVSTWMWAFWTRLYKIAISKNL